MKEENRDPSLCMAFVKSAKEILASHSEINHTWSIDDDKDHCILDIPKNDENGFDITVEVFPRHISVYGEGADVYFDFVEDINKMVQDVLGLVRDLLSPGMRIVEFCSAGKPYGWSMEILKEGEWKREEMSCLVFFNYFGKRSKRVYQNRLLPSRRSPN